MNELVKRTMKAVRQQPGEPVMEPHEEKRSGLCCKRQVTRSQEGLPEPSEHRQVGVEPDALQAAYAEGR